MGLSARPVADMTPRLLEPSRGLWKCLLLSGADVSCYAQETRTEEGREDGFREWMRRGSVAEVVDAVRELRKDYDDG